MKKIFLKLMLVTALAAGITACVEKDENVPACIESMIEEIKTADVWNPPATVWKYHYNGKTVYYIPPRCCDIPSILMDKNCNPLCSPDGGFTGEGDSKCDDFFEKRRDGKLIWEDKRNSN